MAAWRRFGTAALVALILATAGTRLAVAEGSPADLARRVVDTPLPPRSPLDLAVRLRGLSPATPLTVQSAPSLLTSGFQDRFWILDQRNARLFQSPATLRHVTEHAYWFVQNDMAERVAQADLERSAATFEGTTYPTITRYFGPPRSPGVDGASRIVMLLANAPGVAAYFSSADAYPRAINPRSNEHEMIYINLNALRPGSDAFDATLAHELQHMANFNRCPAQEGWVDEGASELAIRLAGFGGAPPLAFSGHPDTQLNAWTAQSAEVIRHYQASYLFLRYVVERAGGWDAVPDLFATCARGEDLFGAFLQRQPIAPGVDELLSDWMVANLLQDATVGDGRYAYGAGGFSVAITGAVSPDAPYLGSLPQYSANYLELPAGAGVLTFTGDTTVPVFSAPGESAGAWWSNRGDSIDARLTRRLDLTAVDRATLHFQQWSDLEDQFDFVYLSVSQDDGQTWQVLPAVHTQPDNATGNDYGSGWTGSSDNLWIDEQVDLSAYAGHDILLRFEYVTDQSYTGQGFAMRNFELPDLGLYEQGAVDDGWQTEGWVRIDGPLAERWNLRLVRWTPGGVTVAPVSVGDDGQATVVVDDTAVRQVLVIAAVAPRTLVPAGYDVSMR